MIDTTAPAGGSSPRDSAVDRAKRDLSALVDYVPALAQLAVPGVPRPWREPTLTPEQRAQLDYEARIELAERIDIAPGEHPDAARPDILDALSLVLDRAVALALNLTRTARCPRPAAAKWGDDPRPYLRLTVALLPIAVTTADEDQAEQIAYYVADQAAAILAEVSQSLSLLPVGQRLQIICPWCQGRTEMAPIGGELTWRVRELPGEQIAICCESGTCNPPSKDVGTWYRGQPCWPLREWEWLARRIMIHHIEKRAA